MIDGEEVTMSLPDAGMRLEGFQQYHFNSHFLTPTDGWSFTIAAGRMPQGMRDALVPGQRVTLSIGGHTQGDGLIDRVAIRSSREGGTEYTIDGRDRLAQACDSCVDPRTKFASGMTLNEFLVAVFKPFGWDSTDMLTDSNAGNRDAMSGKAISKHHGSGRAKKAAKWRGGASLELEQKFSMTDPSWLLKKKPMAAPCKPYPSEGAFAFAARTAQRQGLWIWLSAEGNQLIVAKPDFDQPTVFTITHRVDDREQRNNVLEGAATRDITDQPSIIVADGFSGGGEFGKSRIKAYILNPALDCDHTAIFNAHPDAVALGSDFAVVPIKIPTARPVYLHDDESKTPADLACFLRRELSLRMRKSLEVEYTVMGHTQGDYIWAPDMMVDVQDDVLDIHEPLWILSRTFSKNRGSGTTTQLQLIRPGSLEF